MNDTPTSQQIVLYARNMVRPITEDMKPEHARDRYELAMAIKAAIIEWAAGFTEDMTEYIKNQPGECVETGNMEGPQWYVVKTTKTKKLRKSRLGELLGRCFEDMSFDEFAECLTANPIKPGKLSEFLPDADEFFEVVESEQPALRKTMPPAMRKLMQAKVAAEGGAA